MGSAFQDPEKGREGWRMALGTVQVRGYAERGQHVATFRWSGLKGLRTASAWQEEAPCIECVAGIRAERVAGAKVAVQGRPACIQGTQRGLRGGGLSERWGGGGS